MLEHFFPCPYCLAEISILIDPSLPSQHYIEDCEVCCNPIDIRIELEENEITSFVAKSIEQ
ncbi:CPXCG motif-containing cysteine-rich protein [Algoriphagus sp. NG3]|uniref:CPXCG motif-containing cysteine-rich protein n=1 Tax=Algoriphagus sp. NG3 TaxID=3097546 RepID=UPI002A80DD15|nr:CPXCG motif-containing cysteine-rich protein [Algoriphagus sp. NG3]WPR74349.1 CPXCG motif-containing cysteine-rich protein [Algoriphagus sp. NG3]